MENRALLAFLLSLGVFVAWGFFLSLIQPPPDESLKNKPAAETATTKTLPGGQIASPHSEDGSSLKMDGNDLPVNSEQALSFPGVEKTIDVKKDDMIFRFSTKGAVLKEVLTLKYKDQEGNPINLVKHSPGAHYPLALVSQDPVVNMMLSQGIFESSESDLVIEGEGSAKALTMNFSHSSGFSVNRVFSFKGGDALFTVKTEVKAPSHAMKNLEYTVLWGPSLGGSQESQADYIVFSGPTSFVNGERVETDVQEVKDSVDFKGDIGWTSFQNKYFAAALVPDTGIKSARVQKDKGDVYVGLTLESVQSNASAIHQVYVGTKELRILEEAEHNLVRLIDYGWFGNKFAFLVKPILKALAFFYGLTANYGWSIIFLTLVIKLCFFPLTHKSFKSMKGMQKIQPYVKIIQERNKDDRTRLNEELIDLYKKNKVNPLGGCLPMLLQIPVFIALYHALFFSIELRGAPFMLWIEDLSKSDPYYVTPVLMGATMILQQRITPQVGDPMQQKIMMMLPIVFTFLFITFPVGLVIYWTVNNVLTILQQYYIYHIQSD